MRSKELQDLIISALVLALAFGIVFSGGFRALLSPVRLVVYFLMALVGVSVGFILHEMGHRFMARRFGCFAEFTMWPTGLVVALVSSLFGFIFAAPGAVMIYPRPGLGGGGVLTREKHGLISIAGPVLNLCLAVVFLLLDMAYPRLPFPVFALGARVNTWLAIFNLIPFGPLDGRKILQWSKNIWLITLAVGIGLFIYQYFVF